MKILDFFIIIAVGIALFIIFTIISCIVIILDYSIERLIERRKYGKN